MSRAQPRAIWYGRPIVHDSHSEQQVIDEISSKWTQAQDRSLCRRIGCPFALGVAALVVYFFVETSLSHHRVEALDRPSLNAMLEAMSSDTTAIGALADWLAGSSRDDLRAAARELQNLPLAVRVRAALACLRLQLNRDHLDLWREPGERLAALVEAWLDQPDEAHFGRVREATGHVEMLWNDVAGDTGGPEPFLQTATYTGWTVVHPDVPFHLTHALAGTAKRVGEARTLEAVRIALAAWLAAADVP